LKKEQIEVSIEWKDIEIIDPISLDLTVLLARQVNILDSLLPATPFILVLSLLE
jgi:hypothetical protein